MKRGDKVRRKSDHNDTARVVDVKMSFTPGYGFSGQIKIFIGMGTSWVPMKQWEVIEEENQ
jgi:hypothetical protein